MRLMRLILVLLSYLGLIVSGSLIGMTIGLVAGPIWLVARFKFDRSSKSSKESEENWDLEDLFK